MKSTYIDVYLFSDARPNNCGFILKIGIIFYNITWQNTLYFQNKECEKLGYTASDKLINVKTRQCYADHPVLLHNKSIVSAHGKYTFVYLKIKIELSSILIK